MWITLGLVENADFRIGFSWMPISRSNDFVATPKSISLVIRPHGDIQPNFLGMTVLSGV